MVTRLLWKLFLLFLLPAVNLGQKVGNYKENTHLKLDIEECTGVENCKKVNTAITLDSNWRWVHIVGDYVNCYDGNAWNEEICPDVDTCTENCALEGVDNADWTNTYGISTQGDTLHLQFVADSGNVGSRTYLLAPDEENYYMFYLKNREFTFDVDVSQLPCGLNGALYFVEMDEDGGKGRFPTNKAGASFGTGYCDAQCPADLKFINGEANCMDWTGSSENSGTGHYGSCCVELDIWEANSMATAYTSHPCDTNGPERCEGTPCGFGDERYDGVCDKDGCDLNPWRLGDHQFYGPGSEFVLDTTKPFTVVTQFLTDDGTDNGNLVEMRRVWVQDGKVIPNAMTNMPGIDTVDSITDDFCGQTKVVFGDTDDHGEKGGLNKLGKAMDNGFVLVMSEWDDGAAHMLWLDSNYPPDADPSKPGVNRGPCPTDSGDPGDVEGQYPDATVTWSKIRVGTIGSTYPSGGDNPDPPTPRPTSNPTDKPTNPPNPQGGTISNPLTGLCLAVNSNQAVPNDYTNVMVAACNDGIAEHWEMDSQGQIKHTSSGHCLDEDQSNSEVELYTCSGAQWQKWDIVGKTIVNRNSGRCLDIAGCPDGCQAGTNVWAYDCYQPGNNQQWEFN